MKSLRTFMLCSIACLLSAAAVLVVREQVGAQQKKKDAPPPVVEYKSGIVWDEPAIVTPGKDSEPPSDAIVLFDGKDLSKWEGGDKWIIKDGYAIAAKTGINSKESFGDCQLHLEFA